MKYKPNRFLAKSDLVELLTLSHRSLYCNDHDSLRGLILDLHDVFNFNNALYVQADVTGLLSNLKEAVPVSIHNVSYPPDFLVRYIEKRHYLRDATIRELITTQSPVDCQKTTERYGTAYQRFVRSTHFTDGNTWMHGTLDPRISNLVGFSFVGPVSEKSPRVLEILKYIIPFFSEAFKRLDSQAPCRRYTLTPNEIEVLNWLKEGKTSWEISVVKRCSKRTVDFHVDNIKSKLNVITRAQAVATAIHHGIITFE